MIILPQQFLLASTHTSQRANILPIIRVETIGWTWPWKQPPVKMLKSKYLNCSWALICMLEKLLNFVSLPTDFTVQVLSRKKWAVKQSLRLACTHCIHKMPAVWNQRLRLKWSVAMPFPQRQTHCTEGCSSKRTPSNSTTFRAGKGQMHDFSLQKYTLFLFLCCVFIL